MKQKTLAVLALMAVAGTAFAAPRESASGPATVNVWGDTMTPESFTLNFTGSDGGGAYNATRVRMTAELVSNVAGTWGTDTLVDIQPPTGAMVTIAISAINGTYGTETIDINRALFASYAPAGTWTFTPYDTLTDGDGTVPEALLNNVVITLDDQPIAAPAAVDLGTLTDGANIVTQLSIDPVGVKWVKFTIPEVSAANGRALDVTTNDSIGADSMIAIYNSTGTGILLDDDGGTGFLSLMSFGAGFGPSVPDGSNGQDGNLAAGTYYVAVAEYETTFYINNWEVAPIDGLGGDYQLTVHMDTPPPPAPPTAEDLGTLVDGTPVNRTATLVGADVVWYKVTTLAATAGNGRSVEFTTANSVTTDDSEIGLYGTNGGLIGTNDDIDLVGGIYLSRLVYGATGGANLNAGTYYLAVGSYNTVFGAAFGATSTGPAASFEVTVTQTAGTPLAIFDEAIDGGGDAGQTMATAHVVSGTGPIDAITGTFAGGAIDPDIYQINICNPAAFTIDTNLAGGPDTQLFLFDANGAPVVTNDDNEAGAGATLWSQIDSNSGLVTTAGNYYIAVSRYDVDPIDSLGAEFWLDEPFGIQHGPDGTGTGAVAGWNGVNTTAGAYKINLTGICKVSASVCGPADIGGVGGAPGADGRLDNNDFIVFIDRFFNQLASADIGSTGGAPASDGLFDNNDFIVYIDQFFSGPASCR